MATQNLTQLQLLEAIAVLTNNFTVPPSLPHPHIWNNAANQLQFADATYEQNLGLNLTAYTDGTNIYIQLVTGNPASGA